MKVLIASMYLDYHADAVFWGLERSGVSVTRWTLSDFPGEQRLTMSLSDDASSIRAEDWSNDRDGIWGDCELANGFDVVWNRRFGRPQISEKIKKEDAQFISSESDHARRGIFDEICKDSICINSPATINVFNNKINQLALARKIGLHIPNSLISNNYSEVESFIRNNEKVIFKAFNMPQWYSKRNGSFYTTATTVINESVIKNEKKSIELCPGIYQEYINKKFELRITVMGDRYIAVKLHSQQSPSSIVDWRVGDYDFPIERFDLPESVWKKISKFMQISGLRFGCIDMIVDENERYVFLEINPSGQFLWIEEMNPQIPMLYEFCKFLASTTKFDKFSIDEKVDLRNFEESEVFRNFCKKSKSRASRKKAIFQNNTIIRE